MTDLTNSDPIWAYADAKKEAFAELADRVWATPELCYGEYRSVAEHTRMLRAEGFRVTENLAGLPTAVMGEAGEGGPVIAILGEFDALPGLSQEAGIAEPRPLPGDGNGHGCGHNLLGAAALLAATALKDWLAATGRKGRVRYYGCPAEEGGAAKSFMVRAGAFDDVDAAITWHPDTFTRVWEPLSLANMRIDFTFHGRASHASAAPHLGRSALDAIELMNVGANYMREHMPADARVHYAILDAGGVAPNVVQAKATVRYLVRSKELPGLLTLIERVKKIAEGAALMTETRVETKIVSAVSNLLANTPLEDAMAAAFERLGGVPFDAADRAFAAKIQATLTAGDIESDYRSVGLPVEENRPLCDTVVPRFLKGEPMVGSTDVGDVSWKVPLVQALVACQAIGTPGHSWQVTAQGKTPAAHKGMVHAAKIMAATAVDVISDEVLLDRARNDFLARTQKTPYVCPMPEEVQPPLQPRPVDAD